MQQFFFFAKYNDSLGCVCQDTAEEHKSLGTNSTSTIHESYAASCKHPRKQRSVVRKIQVKVPHQCSLYAMKFEDRSQEESERQERRARGDAWRLAKNIRQLKEKDTATFFSSSSAKLEERGFVVDSSASMHMLRGKT